jgi:hypothetical protein
MSYSLSTEPAVRENVQTTDYPNPTLLEEISDTVKLHFILKVVASGWGIGEPSHTE